MSEGFEQFWAAYPKKTAKKDARKAWSQLAPDDDLQAKIHAALAWQTDSEPWTRDEGAYIPYPATWLRGERWEDEPPATKVYAFTCPHSPPCLNRNACDVRRRIAMVRTG